MKIEIDNEVFAFLEKNAKPFVDTPNTVLRKLLLKKESTYQEDVMASLLGVINKVSAGDFIREVLYKEFGEDFRRIRPYSYMFESNNLLIYFQNFNKKNDSLWYRVTKQPLHALKNSSKRSFIGFTNPAERIVYLIPLNDIEQAILESGWDRDYLEVNIDYLSHKWRELNWDIQSYLKKY